MYNVHSSVPTQPCCALCLPSVIKRVFHARNQFACVYCLCPGTPKCTGTAVCCVACPSVSPIDVLARPLSRAPAAKAFYFERFRASALGQLNLSSTKQPTSATSSLLGVPVHPTTFPRVVVVLCIGWACCGCLVVYLPCANA